MTDPDIAAHYDRDGLLERIRRGIAAAGLDPERLSPEQLAPLDHFHTGGSDATTALAALVPFAPGMRVLDVGGGIGGPARVLAAAHGCRVTVLDLTPGYVAAGEWLTARAGLSELVEFVCGDALAAPLPADHDVVLTQHSTMNIPDKPRLFARLRDALAPRGCYLFHEIVAGDGEVIWPVPWAASGATSFLQQGDVMQRDLEAAGFRLEHFEDVSAATVAWARSRPQGEPPPLGLHVLCGPEFRTLFANLTTNLADGRVRVVRGRARR